MKKKYKILTGVSVSVVVAVVAVVVPLMVMKRNACPAWCDTRCGVTCVDNPKCTGTQCDDPLASCVEGVCLLKHSCSPQGACVPDPNGPFDGETCTCYSVNSANDCEVVGNGGTYTSQTSCEARDSNFQCVPGTGSCERVVGSTTGWESESDCKCFKCSEQFTCVASDQIHPPDGVDSTTCLECGLWQCDNGTCVQSATGGKWEDPAECGCGLCEGGECVATESGGAYPNVSDCVLDDASMCKDVTLGWSCDESAGNPQTCRQKLGGSAPTLEDCRCWTCAGTPPGPLSECMHDASNTGTYKTHQECFENEEDKCGWKYMCA